MDHEKRVGLRLDKSGRSGSLGSVMEVQTWVQVYVQNKNNKTAGWAAGTGYLGQKSLFFRGGWRRKHTDDAKKPVGEGNRSRENWGGQNETSSGACRSQKKIVPRPKKILKTTSSLKSAEGKNLSGNNRHTAATRILGENL